MAGGPASTGFLVEEEVFNGHFRVVRIDTGDSRIYSIDYYRLLEREPECSSSLERGGARLCYIDISEDCQAVASIVQGRVELVNLRLVDRGQYGKPLSLREAREMCLERVEKWLEKEGYAV